MNPAEQNEEREQLKLWDNIVHFFYFYWYLASKRKVDLGIFLIVTFALPLAPYLWVTVSLWKASTEQAKLSYYGDGSMLTLCAGIVCTYFVLIFDYKDDGEKKKNILINLLLFIFYLILLYVFVMCQLYPGGRTWNFNWNIIYFSGFLLFMTFISGLYFNFYRNIDFKEINDFRRSKKSKRLAEQARTSTATDEEIEL